MTAPSLYISPKVMAEVNASQSMKLKVPTDAVTKGFGDDASFTWVELFTIVGSTVAPDKNNDKRLVFELKFRVPDDTPFPTNVGKTKTEWFRVNPDSLSSEANADYRMSLISIGRLKMLVRACGFDLDEGSGVDLAAYFASSGPADPAPVQGVRIFGRLVDKPGKNKQGETKDDDGNQIRQQDITKFVSEAKGNAV